MHLQYFVGVDISKNTLDCTLNCGGEVLSYQRVDNTTPSIREWLNLIKTEHKVSAKNTLYCMESMGAYQEPLVRLLLKRKAALCLESPLRIKRSLGLQRGKSDKIDSVRIAHYAWMNRGHLQLWQEPREIIRELKQLNLLRIRLSKVITQLLLPLKDHSPFLRKNLSKTVSVHCRAGVAALQYDLATTEETMMEIIRFDERLYRLFSIITSVSGAGKILAMEMIIATNEFKSITSAKKYACYVGIAPFEHTSGTSVHGKTRVSKLANRRLKSVLHMPSLSLIRPKGELHEYFKRKVAEGHPKMSVLNAVKNKLVHRIFACVKEDRFYCKEAKTKPLKT